VDFCGTCRPAALAAPRHRAEQPHLSSIHNSRATLNRSCGEPGQDLLLATVTGNVPAVRSLLKHGADPDARNPLDMTPFFRAAGMGQARVMMAPLAGGAKLAPDTPDGMPWTNTCLTGAAPAIQLLLSRGIQVDAALSDGMTSLMRVSNVGVSRTRARL
jgi:uncharacterized protein